MKKLLLPALLLATSAHAAEAYLGFGAGAVRASDFDAAEMNAAFDDGSFTYTTVDDMDVAFRVFGGARLNRHLAIEAAYTDFNEFTGRAGTSGSGVYAAGTVDYDVEGTAFSLAAKGIAPLNDQFALYGKLGLAWWSVDEELSNNGTPLYTASEDGTHPYLAIGASLAATDRLTLQLELERYTRVFDYNVDVLGGSVVYRFR